MKQKSKKTLGISAAVLLVLIALDQAAKCLAVIRLKGRPPFTLIPDVFELSYLENQSAAFGIDLLSILQRIFRFSYFENHPDAFLACKMVFFVIITIIILIFLFRVYLRIPESKRYRWINWILLSFFAGAVGNCIDRIVHHYVIDFFYFKLIDFPVFNIADIYVSLAAFFLIVLGIFYYKEEDFEILFAFRKKKGS